MWRAVRLDMRLNLLTMLLGIHQSACFKVLP